MASPEQFTPPKSVIADYGDFAGYSAIACVSAYAVPVPMRHNNLCDSNRPIRAPAVTGLMHRHWARSG
ncbi:MAG: hypothetical protein BGP05_17240 [Rhizobiales bacterium 62-47]|nr:MAG: hypothetical protein BGP05_17240 [Rhizobiales bacterium 62-47]